MTIYDREGDKTPKDPKPRGMFDVGQTFQPEYMKLYCPECAHVHLDEGEWATKLHRKHLCLVCGHVWQPSYGPTFGV